MFVFMCVHVKEREICCSFWPSPVITGKLSNSRIVPLSPPPLPPHTHHPLPRFCFPLPPLIALQGFHVSTPVVNNTNTCAWTKGFRSIRNALPPHLPGLYSSHSCRLAILRAGVRKTLVAGEWIGLSRICDSSFSNHRQFFLGWFVCLFVSTLWWARCDSEGLFILVWLATHGWLNARCERN